jgi:SAM-dependent methyltransferase
MILLDPSRRVRLPELMDDPGLDPKEHRRALQALSRVALVSGTAGRIWARVRTLAAREAARPLRILDVGCGGGDALVEVARRAARAGRPLEAHGCDLSETALAHAADHADKVRVPVRFFRLDVLDEPLPDGYDLVTSSLFLHHFDDDAAARILREMARAATGGLVQDLRRTRLGYALAWGGLRLLSRSHVTWVDGPRSVQAGFTLEEAAGLAAAAELPRARVQPAWPQRFVLSWGDA